ncbi:hypothetical protein H8R18_06145 [Nanchangia anserum]|uniref:Uncharacterized protein n=1 Tax=Nanchangia anserum TaxID=2692125 RepID=A0A8I0GBA4_9ACTO|nr:hypothetical protein [Nanchangia anserum]MBD3689116.1 hypothetical protein [Nanchangia anserum]QOX81351.1 hypothetical protein H8R18_06145 [Nanchangia anserum]
MGQGTQQGRLAALADERARYAASITRRAAAAKRRLALAVALTVAAAVLAVLAATSVLAWGWVAVPLAALVATLVLGARATKVGRDNDAIMEARIERLRHEARTGERAQRDSRASRDLGHAALDSARGALKGRRADDAEAVSAAGEGQVIQLTPMNQDAPSRDAEDNREVAATAGPAPRAKVAHVDAASDDESVAVSVPRAKASESVTDPFSKPLTPMPLPRVMTPMRPMIQSSDIDTKELLRQQRSEVAARIPFRPTRPVTPEGVPMTSAEVAAGGRVQFSVDDIITRRCVGD